MRVITHGLQSSAILDFGEAAGPLLTAAAPVGSLQLSQPPLQLVESYLSRFAAAAPS
jgi:hypothetical protein